MYLGWFGGVIVDLYVIEREVREIFNTGFEMIRQTRCIFFTLQRRNMSSRKFFLLLFLQRSRQMLLIWQTMAQSLGIEGKMREILSRLLRFDRLLWRGRSRPIDLCLFDVLYFVHWAHPFAREVDTSFR